MIQGKNLFKLLFILILSIILSGTVSATFNSNSTLSVDQQAQVINAQIPFVENTGQTDSNVTFYADTFYGTAFVTNSSVFHSILGQDNTTLVVKEEFLDENGQVITFWPVGLEQGTAKVDFYIGNDSNQWQIGVITWNIINLGELYPGITVLLRANGSNVEKIFQIGPEANPELIKIRITGADNLNIDEKGNLNLQSTLGNVQLSSPIAYQDDQNIDANYILTDNIYRFQVGTYNNQKTLTIDPTLQYSTYLGGTDFGDYYSGYDFGDDITVDSSGNIYLTGITRSTDFPTTTGTYQTTNNGQFDVFISKLALNGAGAADLLYSTYLGGTGTENGDNKLVLANGYIYITGITESTNFPTTSGAYQTTYGGGYCDVFISKLALNGEGTNDLLYSTFLGGYNNDYGNDIAVDGSGNIYITGHTYSTNFPTTNGAYQTTNHGIQDAFISKLVPNGMGTNDLLYSTYLGGTSGDWPWGIAADSSGNIYITGWTGSTDFPTTTGAYQTTFGGVQDVFISKLVPNGMGTNDLLYSTYLGGTGYDEDAHGIAVDGSGNIYISGQTGSTNFPTTTGAYQTTFGGFRDVFISKLALNGMGTNDLLYSTYLGGTGYDEEEGMAVDGSGNIYITGWTGSTNFPTTTGAYQTTNHGGTTNGVDAFISKLTPNGAGAADLIYSTYLGGTSDDYGRAITLDDDGNIYITGETYSNDFPTTSGAYDTTYNGKADSFVSKLHLPIDVYPSESIQAAINAAEPGDTILVHGNNGSSYTYSENVTVDRLLTIICAGDGAVTIQAANTDQAVILINSGGSGSTIQGFNITGATNAFGIQLASANNCQLIGNTLSSNFIGLFIQNSNNNTISGNTIHSNGWLGIGLDNSSDNIVNDDNEISGNVEGIYLVNNSNVNTITSNNIHHNFDAGINILNSSIGNIISDNFAISNNGVIGILIRDAENNTISGNNIQSNGWAGIVLDNSSDNIINGFNNISSNLEGLNITNSYDNYIDGNTITGNTNIGISIINGSNYNIIINNTAISNNGIIGVYLRDTNDNTIYENNIQSNNWVGICFDQATDNDIDGSNNISGNLEGLYIVNNSNNNRITHNNIHENFDTGIYIDGSTLNQIFASNTISNNGVIGILLRGADGNTITGNIIAGNNFAGIALDNSDNNNVNGENIISSNQMGIYVVNTSNGNTINNNTLQNNIWGGIVLDTSTNSTVYQNNFINNPVQALAQSGSGNIFYQGIVGNYWSDWSSTDPRPIYGNEGLYDQHPNPNQEWP